MSIVISNRHHMRLVNLLMYAIIVLLYFFPLIPVVINEILMDTRTIELFRTIHVKAEKSPSIITSFTASFVFVSFTWYALFTFNSTHLNDRDITVQNIIAFILSVTNIAAALITAKTTASWDDTGSILYAGIVLCTNIIPSMVYAATIKHQRFIRHVNIVQGLQINRIFFIVLAFILFISNYFMAVYASRIVSPIDVEIENIAFGVLSCSCIFLISIIPAIKYRHNRWSLAYLILQLSQAVLYGICVTLFTADVSLFGFFYLTTLIISILFNVVLADTIDQLYE